MRITITTTSLDITIAPYLLEGREQKVKRLDPHGCGCTDCITGEFGDYFSMPVTEASDELVLAMLTGHVGDATGIKEFDVRLKVESDRDGRRAIVGVEIDRSTWERW